MLKRDISEVLNQALAAARAAGALPPGETPAAVLDEPRDPAHGDYASNLALVLAKPMGRAPMAVATAIAAHLPAQGLVCELQAAAPGFLNVKIAPARLQADLAARLAAGADPVRIDLGGARALALDHPSWEAARPQGVDAARRAAIGEALAAVLVRAGYAVARASGPDAHRVSAKAVGLLRDGVAIDPRGEMTLQAVLDEIGSDAARYFLLSRPAHEGLALDLGLARRQTADNAAFYLQYTHARIGGLVRMVGGELPDLELAPEALATAALARLEAAEELQLLGRLAAYPDELAAVVRTLEPARLTRYAQALAGDFHRCQARCPLLTEDAALTRARLALAVGVRGVLADLSVGLLSICAPETVEGALGA